MNNLKTTYDNIMVKIVYEETLNNSSIIIREQAEQYHGDFYGIVVAIGEENKSPIKIGDKLLFDRHEGKELEYDGEKYLVLRPDHILAKVEE